MSDRICKAMAESPLQGQGHPDPLLIGRLMSALGVPCDVARLERAAGEADPAGEPADTVRWLRRLLVAAEIRELAPVLVPWQQFDPARLPALIERAGVWLLAEATDNGKVRLSGMEGEPETLPASALEGATVLWVRAPQADADDTLASNLAARLVWKELFVERGWLWQVIVATVV